MFWLFLPSNKDSSITIEPAMASFHYPPSRFFSPIVTVAQLPGLVFPSPSIRDESVN